MSGLESLIRLKACLLYSLRGGKANIDRHAFCFAGGFLLITKFWRLFAVFVVIGLFFDCDHWLYFLLIRCDHGLLLTFLMLLFTIWFVQASLAALSNIFLSAQRLIIAVHARLIIPRILAGLAFFEVLAQVVGKSQGFFIGSLRFG